MPGSPNTGRSIIIILINGKLPTRAFFLHTESNAIILLTLFNNKNDPYTLIRLPT